MFDVVQKCAYVFFVLDEDAGIEKENYLTAKIFSHYILSVISTPRKSARIWCFFNVSFPCTYNINNQRAKRPQLQMTGICKQWQRARNTAEMTIMWILMPA